MSFNLSITAYDGDLPGHEFHGNGSTGGLGCRDASKWQRVGGQKGSNPGGTFVDEHGTKFYVKVPKSEDQAKNEVCASKLYQLAGINIVPSELVEKDGKLGVASEFRPGLNPGSGKQLAAAAGAKEGFVTDAWLCNRDSVGLEYDNMFIGSKGEAVRLDPGGALSYRAMGGAKPGFGETVGELKTLRDPAWNGPAASVFGKMTQAELAKSAEHVTKLSDVKIRSTVMAHGPGSHAERAALADKLIARKQDIAKTFGLHAADALSITAMDWDPNLHPKGPDGKFTTSDHPGSFKNVKAFVMHHVAKGALSHKDIAEAASIHFGTKTDEKSVKWYINEAAKKGGSVTTAVKSGTGQTAAQIIAPHMASLKDHADKLYGKGYAGGTVAKEIAARIEVLVGAVEAKKYLDAAHNKFTFTGNWSPKSTLDKLYNGVMTSSPSKPVGSPSKPVGSPSKPVGSPSKPAGSPSKPAGSQPKAIPGTHTNVQGVTFTNEERQTLLYYTGSGHREINRELRAGNIGSGNSHVKNLEKLIDAVPPSSKEETFHRGIKREAAVKLFGENIVPGGIITDKGFVSISRSPGIAKSFAGDNGIVITVRTSPGTKAFDVENHTSVSQEAELILNRGSSFRIVSVKTPLTGDNRTYVEVEYVQK